MSDNEINVAIAEACPEIGFWMDHESQWHFKDGSRCRGGQICTDLNAMHEAEKEIVKMNKPDLIFAYCENLCKAQGVINSVAAFIVVCATARQRAEAFLRTIGKWQEQEKGR